MHGTMWSSIGAPLEEVWGPVAQEGAHSRAAPGGSLSRPSKKKSSKKCRHAGAKVGAKAVPVMPASGGSPPQVARTTAPELEACNLFEQEVLSEQLRAAMDTFEDVGGSCPEYEMGPVAPFDEGACSAAAAGVGGILPVRRQIETPAAAAVLGAIPGVDEDFYDHDDTIKRGGISADEDDDESIVEGVEEASAAAPATVAAVSVVTPSSSWPTGSMDVALYLGSGVLLILLLDVFTRLGTRMGAAASVLM